MLKILVQLNKSNKLLLLIKIETNARYTNLYTKKLLTIVNF